MGTKGALLSLAVLGCVSFAASTLYLIVAVGSHGAKLDRLMNETQTLLAGAEAVRDNGVTLVRQEQNLKVQEQNLKDLQNLVLKSMEGFHGQLYELNATSVTQGMLLDEVIFYAYFKYNDLNSTSTAARAKLGQRLDESAEAIDAIKVELQAMACEAAMQKACSKRSGPARGV